MAEERQEPLEEEPWVVLVVPLKGSDVPMHHRVKRWLKAGLRSFGLRCVEVRTARATEVDQAKRTMGDRNGRKPES